MSKPLSAAPLHLYRQRAVVPGTAEERERDYADTLHRLGPLLIRSELSRIQPGPEPAPHSLFNRISQAIDILLNRGHVYIDRRDPRV